MSAQILQFPGKRPPALQEHQLPAHWSRELRSYYLHVTDDGFSTHERAFSYCDAMARVPPQRSDESGADYRLRRVQAAVAQLPRHSD